MSYRFDLPGILRIFAGAAILLSAMACYATDQTSHSCRDDSIAATNHTVKPAERSKSGAAERGRHSVLLSWRPPDGPVKGYIIERQEPGAGYKAISRFPIRETSCTDFDVVAGHTYSYRARSVGIAGAVSSPSNEASATVKRP